MNSIYLLEQRMFELTRENRAGQQYAAAIAAHKTGARKPNRLAALMPRFMGR